MYVWIPVALAFLMVLCAPPLSAAEKASGETADLVQAWKSVNGKVLAMAEDFPEDKYDYRPTPGVRTFAEQLLHIAGASYFFNSLVKGERPGEEDLSREKYKTKADVVGAFKKAMAEGEGFIRQAGDTGLARAVKLPWQEEPVTERAIWILAIQHAGEHYGNLVVYYRLNGIVPPASRSRGN